MMNRQGLFSCSLLIAVVVDAVVVVDAAGVVEAVVVDAVSLFCSPQIPLEGGNEGKIEAKGLKGKSNEWRLNDERRTENGQNLQ